MNAPTRKFSTVLPSVASLRSKFEKPGQPPPMFRVPSPTGGLLKTASSQTALVKPIGSPTSLEAKVSSPEPMINTVDANGPSSPLAIKPEPLGDGSSEVKKPETPFASTTGKVETPEARQPSVCNATQQASPPNVDSVSPGVSELRRPSAIIVTPSSTQLSSPKAESAMNPESRRSSVVEARRPSTLTSPLGEQTAGGSEATRSVVEARRPSTLSPTALQASPASPNDTNLIPTDNGRRLSIDQRRTSIAASPTSIQSQPPPIPASRANPESSPISPISSPPPIPASRKISPETLPEQSTENIASTPQLKSEGILYAVDGYSVGLEAMRALRKELQVRLGREGYLDATTCRSVGMQSFLDNCEAVFAFLEGATVSKTVRYQIARGFYLGKKVAVLSDEHCTTPRALELLDQLAEQMSTSSDESLGKSKEEWRSLLNSSIIQYVFTPNTEERRILTLAPIERLLTGKVQVYGVPIVPVPELLTGTCAFMITGFDSDAMARAEIEFIARGYSAVVSDKVVRAIVGVFFLPGSLDEKRDDYGDRRLALESALRECRGRGMTVIGVASRFPGSWVPPELDGLVFPANAAPEDIIRACDVPAIALKTQGDALEPMRVIAEKARRYSPESGRDTVIAELLQGKDKLTILTAPSGWGKTTLLAELCRRYNRVVASLSHSILDQTETVVALFFFNRLDPSRSNFAANCLRSISRQLAGTVPGFTLDEGAQDVLDDPSASVTSLLEALIVQPAMSLSTKGRPPSRRVFIVIDGLDECEDFDQLQIALNAKWQSVPGWLSLICSAQVRPQIVARHVEMGKDKHINKYLNHLLGLLWLVPDANEIVTKLENVSEGNFLWTTVCEPIIVNACESAALAQATAYLPYFESSLPSQPGIAYAVKHVFDRYAESENNPEKVRQAYSLAICAPRSFLPVEIYSYCGVETVPPLLVIEALCVKPLHSTVHEALTTDCGVKLDALKDHGLISDALEKAYLSANLTTPVAKRFAAAHASMHARLAGRMNIAKSWFEDFHRLFDAVAQCVRETGDALRTVQDGEDCGANDEIVDVVRLASSAVAFDIREFPGQVIGRLPADHSLSLKATEFVKNVLVKELKTMVAIPNPHFSGLTPARGPLRKVLRHRSPVLCAAESNGFVLTCAGPVGFIWNVAHSERLAILKGHTEDIRACIFSCSKDNGDLFNFTAITGSADHSARLWQGSFKSSQQTAVLSCIRTFNAHDAAVTCIAYQGPSATTQEATLCTGSSDKTIIVWDANTGQQRTRLRGHTGAIRGLYLSNDLKLLSGSQDKTCRIWDLTSNSEVGKLEGHTRDVSAVAIFKDRYYTACFDGVARAYDVSTKTQVMEYKGHTQRINALNVSPDGKYIATASYDGTARVFNAETGAVLIVLKGHTNDVASVRFCTDSTRLVTASLDCEVRFWSATSDIVERFQKLAKRSHEEQVTCSYIGKDYACSGSADGVAKVWKLSSGELIANLKQEGMDESLCGVAVSNDGQLIVTASQDGQVAIWHVSEPLQPRFVIPDAHKDAIEEVAISSDGRYAKTLSYDRQMIIWDLVTGKNTPLAELPDIPLFPMQPAPRKQDSRHVLGPTGSSVGFTLDATQFSVALDHDEDSPIPRTYGEVGNMFYLWEWHSPP